MFFSMLIMIIDLVEPMNKILFGQILLTVITVFVIFMSIYSIIPKIRKKYQGRTVRMYIAIGGVMMMILICMLTCYRMFTL